jgi:acyl carrier protein
MAMSNSSSKSEIIFSTILEILTPRLSRLKLGGSVDASTQLLEVGLIDSTDLLDVILEVEHRCAVEFDPMRVDFEGTLTFGNLVSAFTVPGTGDDTAKASRLA